MIPLLVLAVTFAIFRLAGWLGVAFFNNWLTSLRAALACMFLLTASAHWGRRRPDLIRMVPAGLGPAGLMPAGLIVTLTGILEIVGAVGLLIPATVQPAAIGLTLLLIAMFPANIRAARQNIEIAGRKPAKLAMRLPLQIVFILATLVAGGFLW
jgi:uncharacterized membrane protein